MYRQRRRSRARRRVRVRCNSATLLKQSLTAVASLAHEGGGYLKEMALIRQSSMHDLSADLTYTATERMPRLSCNHH